MKAYKVEYCRGRGGLYYLRITGPDVIHHSKYMHMLENVSSYALSHLATKIESRIDGLFVDFVEVAPEDW